MAGLSPPYSSELNLSSVRACSLIAADIPFSTECGTGPKAKRGKDEDPKSGNELASRNS